MDTFSKVPSFIFKVLAAISEAESLKTTDVLNVSSLYGMVPG